MATSCSAFRALDSRAPQGPNEYERLRLERIAANQERLRLLDVEGAKRRIREQLLAQRPEQTKQRKRSRDNVASSADLAEPRPPERRRSSRLEGRQPVSYGGAADALSDGESAPKKHRAHASPVPPASGEELYDEEDEKKLGSYKVKWELCVDGYNGEGKRVYDQARGKTCHQCRQKTLGLRTVCSSCRALRGQLCGDCLFTRYGENIREALQNRQWECPVCRGICNCSICRIRRGWAPTGLAYYKAVELGYISVAHYLMATKRRMPAAPSSLPTQANAGGMGMVQEMPEAETQSSSSRTVEGAAPGMEGTPAACPLAGWAQSESRADACCTRKSLSSLMCQILTQGPHGGAPVPTLWVGGGEGEEGEEEGERASGAEEDAEEDERADAEEESGEGEGEGEAAQGGEAGNAADFCASMYGECKHREKAGGGRVGRLSAAREARAESGAKVSAAAERMEGRRADTGEQGRGKGQRLGKGEKGKVPQKLGVAVGRGEPEEEGEEAMTAQGGEGQPVSRDEQPKRSGGLKATAECSVSSLARPLCAGQSAPETDPDVVELESFPAAWLQGEGPSNNVAKVAPTVSGGRGGCGRAAAGHRAQARKRGLEPVPVGQPGHMQGGAAGNGSRKLRRQLFPIPADCRHTKGSTAGASPVTTTAITSSRSRPLVASRM